MGTSFLGGLQPKRNNKQHITCQMTTLGKKGALIVTHPQFLTGLKCESQTENSGRTRSRSTFPGSQHYRGVEGRAGVPEGDQEEVTSFTHSQGPAQNQHQMVSAQLERFWCQDERRATWTHKTHHGPDLREATTFPLIVYSAPLHRGHIQMAFCPGTPKRESQICISRDSRDFEGT